jgi:hypothetical protein
MPSVQNLLAPDDDQNRPTRELYYPILAAALAKLEDHTAVARRIVYERARAMIAEQVRGMHPPLAPELIARHRLALELAIQQHEIEEMGRLRTPTARRAETRTAVAAARPPQHGINFPQANRPVASRQQRTLASLRNMVDLPSEQTYGLPPSSTRHNSTEPADQDRVARDPELPSIELVAVASAPERAGGIWPHRLGKAALLTSVLAATVVVGNWQADRVGSWLDGLAAKAGTLIERLTLSQLELVDAANAVPGEPARALDMAANQPAHAVAETAAVPVVLFEDGPDLTSGKPFSGSVSWRSESILSPLWRGSERAVRAEIDIPGKATVTVLLRRNFDQGFPASHAIVITASFGGESAGIKEIPGVLMKREGEPRGSPLRGVPMPTDGCQFQIQLSAAGNDIEHNEQMLRERPMLGIPIIHNDGRRSMLMIAKGGDGDRAFADAFAQWGRATPIETPNSLLTLPENLPTGRHGPAERPWDPAGIKKGDGRRSAPCGPNVKPCVGRPLASSKLATETARRP